LAGRIEVVDAKVVEHLPFGDVEAKAKLVI
jgi:hypothetical protein